MTPIPRLALVALAAALLGAPGISNALPADAGATAADKAEVVYNFIRFTEWPTLLYGAPIIICFAGEDEIAAALVVTVRAQTISGHALEIWRMQNALSLVSCHVLFIASSETRRYAGRLEGIRALPVLTISDAKGFNQAGGIIELYVEAGRMRFAVNIDAVGRSGLNLSSRLLGLARIVRDGHAQ